MAKAKMSTGKKVGIGTAVVVAVGAILCYFFCPCFKKKSGVTGSEENYDFGAASTGESGDGLPQNGGPAVQPVLPRVPAPYTHTQVKSELASQQGLAKPPAYII